MMVEVVDRMEMVMEEMMETMEILMAAMVVVMGMPLWLVNLEANSQGTAASSS